MNRLLLKVLKCFHKYFYNQFILALCDYFYLTLTDISICVITLNTFFTYFKIVNKMAASIKL